MSDFKLGERIAHLRKSRNLTQAELAAKLGVSQSALAMWEKGRREPDMLTVSQISSIFKISIDFLLGLTEDPSSGSFQSTDSPQPQSIRAWLRTDTDLLPEEKEALSDELEDYFRARKERLLRERASKKE